MTGPAKQKVLATLDAEEDFLVGLTRDLVRIPTVNPKFEQDAAINREAELQAFLKGVMEEAGLACELQEVFPGRPNLVGHGGAGSDARSLILNGHIDVVPVGERSLWSVDPFGGELRDGRLYGRGAVDMKAGVAAAVAAVRAIRRAGVELEGWVDVHSVVDEEAGGFGSIDAVKKNRRAAAAVIVEPTWGAVMPAEGGLEWVRVTIRGRTGHAGWRFNEIFPQPDTPGRLLPGVNAIELGHRFMAALADYERGRTRRLHHPLVPPGLNTINPGAVFGGAGIGPNGLPVVVTNPAIIPDVFVVDLDYKFLPNETVAGVRAEFEAFVHHFAQTDPWLRDHPPVVQWNLYGLHFPPLNTPVDHPVVAGVIENLGLLGMPAPVKGFEAVCDAAHYAGAGVASVIHGPDGDGFHGADEYVTVESLTRTAKVLAATAIDFCGVRSAG